MFSSNQKAVESRARRIAKANDCLVVKSRRNLSADNLGDMMVIDAASNCVILGSSFDASAEEVLEFFSAAR